MRDCPNPEHPASPTASRQGKPGRLRRLLLRHPRSLSLALVALVFGVDLALPLGVASAVPYTFAVLLALSAKPRGFGPGVALLCGVLTLAKMGIVPERGTTELWKVIVNRFLALFAIGMTTLLGALRRRAAEEREEAEERAKQHQADLAHAGRLTLLGQLAAGLAHELNQPLAAICLQADIAARVAESGRPVSPAVTDALSEIAGQAARAAEVVRGIRRMARSAPPGMDRVDVNEVVRTVARLLEWYADRARVTVQLALADPPGHTVGDRVQIEQVVFNLVQNAIEAIVERGPGPRTVTVTTATDPGLATVTVCDTGAGLADPGRVFDRFYTTKPTGVGMGLAISKAIVDAHGGTIRADALADGTRFSFSLPAARSPSQEKT